MAKISDELREWVRRALADEHMDLRELDALADRVDRETVELPRDRDGVPIHVGDTVYCDDSPDQLTVNSFTVNGCDSVCVRTASDGYLTVSAARLKHERPDSFERIADELEGLSVDSMISDINLVSACALDLAKRIRKLAKREG